MSNFREKAQALTKPMVGQMIGDDLLVREGQQQGAMSRSNATIAGKTRIARRAGNSGAVPTGIGG